MIYYAGLDVGLKRTSVCVVDETGKQVHESEVAGDAEAIDKALCRLKREYKTIGLETGQPAIFLTKALRAKGWKVVCMDARQVAAALSTQVNKTDRNDARGIAHLLRCGLYREVHVKRCGVRPEDIAGLAQAAQGADGGSGVHHPRPAQDTRRGAGACEPPELSYAGA